MRGDRDGLRRLADSTRAAARRTGLVVEHRTYRPHVTLARADGGVDLRPLVERLVSWQGPPWVATRLQLVRSRLGAAPGGSALHEPIAGGRWSQHRRIINSIEILIPAFGCLLTNPANRGGRSAMRTR